MVDGGEKRRQVLFRYYVFEKNNTLRIIPPPYSIIPILMATLVTREIDNVAVKE